MLAWKDIYVLLDQRANNNNNINVMRRQARSHFFRLCTSPLNLHIVLRMDGETLLRVAVVESLTFATQAPGPCASPALSPTRVRRGMAPQR